MREMVLAALYAACGSCCRSLQEWAGACCSRRSRLLALDSCGCFRCCPSCGPQLLQVTVMTVTNLKIDTGAFYLELYTEPGSGQHPKISRTHFTAASGSVDLNDEVLELDWFGDETQVVVHLVGKSGNKQSQDVPVGELLIPAARVRRYAGEVPGHEGDMACGSRSFELGRPQVTMVLERKRRFQDMLIPANSSLAKTIFEKVVKRITTDQGVHIPTDAEWEELERENQILRSEHTSLLEIASQNGHAPGETMWSARSEKGESAAVVQLRFQLVARGHMRSETRRNFKAASFQIDNDV